jgi:hypothetical protein
MNLWLDDLREMPQGYDIHVKTAAEAIRLLGTGDVELISLDHDLGPPEAGTGYDVAKYILEGAYTGKLKRLEVRLHTANPVGRANMASALQRAEHFWIESGQ